MISFNVTLLALFILLLSGAILVKILQSKQLEILLFVVLSVACVFLATLRPFGITRDDRNYDILAEQTCKISECGLAQLPKFDVGYFFLLSILKEFSDDNERVVLLLAGLSLGLKLFLIGRFTSYSVLSLYFYYCLFFLFHDVTQLRVSVAISFFLLALYFMLVLRKKMFGVVAYIATMVTHFQALVAPLPQIAHVILKRSYWIAIGLVVLSQLAVAIHIVPISSIMWILMDQESRRISQNLFIDQTMFSIRGTNVLITLLLIVIVFPLRKMDSESKVFDVCFSSVVIGYVFFWLFAGLPVIPERVLQFFWVPLAMLVSFGRKHNATFAFTILVGGIFFFLTAFVAPILEQ